jgi:integrase
MTLGNWLQEWLDVYAPVRCSSGVTLERYQSLANYLLLGKTPELSLLSATPLTDVSHVRLESALLRLLRVRSARKEHLSRRTVRAVGAVISVALEKAVRLDMIPVNPMSKVELPPAEKPQARSLTLEEVKALRRVCRGDWTYLFVELALATGLRRGELLALEWPDVDHSRRALSVSKSLEETAKGLKLKLPKSGKGRALTLPHSVLVLLPRYGARGELKKGLIFPGPDGKWRKPAIVSQVIVRRLRKAGIAGASLHSLRHTHATALLSRGMPVPAVSVRLGHADPNITLKAYGHAMPLDDLRVAEEWDRLVTAL